MLKWTPGACFTHFQRVCLETHDRIGWDEWMKCGQGKCRVIHDIPNFTGHTFCQQKGLSVGWGTGAQSPTIVCQGAHTSPCRPMLRLVRCMRLKTHLVLPVGTSRIHCAQKNFQLTACSASLYEGIVYYNIRFCCWTWVSRAQTRSWQIKPRRVSMWPLYSSLNSDCPEQNQQWTARHMMDTNAPPQCTQAPGKDWVSKQPKCQLPKPHAALHYQHMLLTCD